MRKLLVLLALAGCGFVDYKAAPVGKFEGALFVMWVDESQRGLGDGSFVFVPTADPLRFTRGAKGTVQVIEPAMMYTDGGSIPQMAQAMNGFSPWGYAPAYMVHDWLFVARKCALDGQATPEEAVVAEMPFIESAEIAAEAIKSLIAAGKVQPNDVAPQAISYVVAGPVSRQLWNKKGGCQRIKPEHLAMIRRALPSVQPVMKAAPGKRRMAAPVPQGPVAKVVQVVGF